MGRNSALRMTQHTIKAPQHYIYSTDDQGWTRNFAPGPTRKYSRIEK